MQNDISNPLRHTGKPNSFNSRISRSSSRIFSLYIRLSLSKNPLNKLAGITEPKGNV